MKLLDRAVRGLRATVQGGYGGRFSSWGGGFPSREGIDNRAEAGARVDNSIVYTAIQKTTLAMLEADLIVKRKDGSGKRKRVEGHPIEVLLQKPVPWYDGSILRSCWQMALILGGNGYTLKHRSSQGRLIGLEYLPISTCRPFSQPGSGNFIDWYQVALSIGVRQIAPEHILHLRWHTVNPWTPALAIGPWKRFCPRSPATIGLRATKRPCSGTEGRRTFSRQGARIEPASR
jgi:hypothetical protein